MHGTFCGPIIDASWISKGFFYAELYRRYHLDVSLTSTDSFMWEQHSSLLLSTYTLACSMPSMFNLNFGMQYTSYVILAPGQVVSHLHSSLFGKLYHLPIRFSSHLSPVVSTPCTVYWHIGKSQYLRGIFWASEGTSTQRKNQKNQKKLKMTNEKKNRFLFFTRGGETVVFVGMFRFL